MVFLVVFTAKTCVLPVSQTGTFNGKLKTVAGVRMLGLGEVDPL